ncbi:MAG: hypothetical protein AABZ47_06855 [Planctomycetota bacterium]
MAVEEELADHRGMLGTRRLVEERRTRRQEEVEIPRPEAVVGKIRPEAAAVEQCHPVAVAENRREAVVVGFRLEAAGIRLGVAVGKRQAAVVVDFRLEAGAVEQFRPAEVALKRYRPAGAVAEFHPEVEGAVQCHLVAVEFRPEGVAEVEVEVEVALHHPAEEAGEAGEAEEAEEVLHHPAVEPGLHRAPACCLRRSKFPLQR